MKRMLGPVVLMLVSVWWRVGAQDCCRPDVADLYLGCNTGMFIVQDKDGVQVDTPALCRKHCRQQGYKHMGLDGGYTCRCVNLDMAPLLTDLRPSTGCTIPCRGDSRYTCGSLGQYDWDLYRVCADGRFGENCEGRCHCKDGAVCDNAAGNCPSDLCDRGWRGMNCSTPCTEGTFGYNCIQPCGQCRAGTSCHREAGECIGGCAPGWLPPLCDRCDSNWQPPLLCDRCKPGWQPPNCDIHCAGATYGQDCSNNCGHCRDGASCHRETGDCTGGCVPGWHPPRCDVACVGETYGDDCRHNCGNCRNDSACDKETGVCVGGCMPGWQPGLCQDTCQPGVDCQEACGQCSPGRSCDTATGVCVDMNSEKKDDGINITAISLGVVAVVFVVISATVVIKLKQRVTQLTQNQPPPTQYIEMRGEQNRGYDRENPNSTAPLLPTAV